MPQSRTSACALRTSLACSNIAHSGPARARNDLATDGSAAPGADVMCVCADDSVNRISAISNRPAHAGWELPGCTLVGGPLDARPLWRQQHTQRAGARRALRGQCAAANSAAAGGGVRAVIQLADMQGCSACLDRQLPEACSATQVVLLCAAQLALMLVLGSGSFR